MPSVNKVIIVGNLTRDPATKQLPNQTMVTEFGLAMNRKFKSQGGEDREEVCFVDCAAFGRQAEVIQKYCQKGKSLYVEGRLRYDSWDDKNGHGKRSKLSIVVENFQFLGGKDDGPRTDRSGDYDQTRGRGGRAQQPFGDEEPAPPQDRDDFKEADIPF